MSKLQYFETQHTMAGSVLPLRSTLIELNCGHHVLISPLQFSDDQLLKLKNHKINALVAPNCFHHVYILRAIDQLEVSQVYAAPGLEKKRPDVPWTVTLSAQTWPYQDELPVLVLEGMPSYGECVFFHKESRTLITTDLLFNMKNLQPGLSTLAFKLFGTFNKTSVSKLLKWFCKNPQALEDSLKQMLKWDFDRLVMAHGEIIETGAKEILTRALLERGLIKN